MAISKLPEVIKIAYFKLVKKCGYFYHIYHALTTVSCYFHFEYGDYPLIDR